MDDLIAAYRAAALARLIAEVACQRADEDFKAAQADWIAARDRAETALVALLAAITQ